MLEYETIMLTKIRGSTYLFFARHATGDIRNEKKKKERKETKNSFPLNVYSPLTTGSQVLNGFPV